MYFDLLFIIYFYIFFYSVGIYEYRSWVIGLCLGVFSVILFSITTFGGLFIQILFQAAFFFSLAFVKDIKKWLIKKTNRGKHN